MPRIESDSASPVRRAEIALILGITMLGGWFRGHRLSEIGLSHFDEGIYAISGLWPYTGCFESNQGFYSPPGFPFLVGLSYLAFGGPSDTAAIAVSWLFGTLTIPLAWWVGRNWWGPTSGIGTSFVVTIDGLLSAFSRTALTDTTFTFAFLLAFYLVQRAMVKMDWKSALAAGIAVGCTWNIKYNGFLPLAISVGWLLPIPGRFQARWTGRFAQFVRIAVIAIVCYVPWASWFHMKQPGGYSELIRHQRGYLAGWAAIPRHQLQAIRWLGEFDPVENRSGLAWGWVLGAQAVFLAGVASWKSRLPIPTLLVAFVGLLALPGIYTFYLRLWLPTLLVLELMCTAGLVHALQYMAEKPKQVSLSVTLLTIFLAPTWLIGPIACGYLIVADAKQETSNGYRQPCDEIASWRTQQEFDKRPVFGFLRPPAYFYFAEMGIPVSRLAGDTASFERIPPGSILLIDPARHDSPDFARLWKLQQANFKFFGEFAIQPSLITLLDNFEPADISKGKSEFKILAFERNGGSP